MMRTKGWQAVEENASLDTALDLKQLQAQVGAGLTSGLGIKCINICFCLQQQHHQ